MQNANNKIETSPLYAVKKLEAELESMYELTSKLEELSINIPDSEKYTSELKKKINNLMSQIDEISTGLNQSLVYEQPIQTNFNHLEMINNANIDTANASGSASIPVKSQYDFDFKMKDTRVLLADDNNINNYVVLQMLSRFNIEVDVVNSGEEALELYRKKNYDIILMDYLMPPGIDGIETIRRIREMGERGANQLIIGLTANNLNNFTEDIKKYNVELVLFKPIKYQHMAIILLKDLPHKIER